MKLFSIHSWKSILLVTVIVKVSYAFYLSFLLQCSDPQLAPGWLTVKVGDTFSYTGAMENYVTKGRYYFYNGKENIYAGRLPHYSLLYLFFRQFASQSTSFDLVGLVQIITECIAITLLILLTYQLLNNRLASLIVWGMCLLSSNWTLLSLSASPESLSCSFIVFSIFYYYQYLKIKDTKNLLLCSLCLAILVTLKPYFFISFIILGISFIKHDQFSWKNILRKTFLASIPLTLLLIPWIWRNYTIYNRFIPLQVNTTAGYNYTSTEFAFRRFVGAWGGDIIYWERSSAGCYFIPDPKVACTFQMPGYAFTENYGEKEITQVRNDFVVLQNRYSVDLDRKTSLEFDRLTKLYIEDKPVQYYLISPLRLLVRFVNHSGSYYMPVHVSNSCYAPAQLILKGIQSLLYWTAISFGLTGLILLAIKSKDGFMVFFPLFVIILFPFLFRIVEWRYLRTIEPILYVGLAFILMGVFEIVKNKKNIFR